MNNDKKITELEERLVKIQSQLDDLSGNFYRNNFTSSQVFNKDCIFTSRLKVPSYDSAPTVGEVGDLIEVAAELYICTSTGPVVFTLVGSQV